MSTELQVRDGGEEKPPPLRSNVRFRLLWGGSALSVMAERSSTMAFTLLVLWHTGSKSAAGLVGFSALLPMLVMQLPAGVLVDRWDRRRVMLFCVAGRALAIGSVAVSLVGDDVRVWHIALVAFVQGSLTVFYQLSERAAVRGVVPPQQVSTAMAQNEARSRAVNFVGHPASGVLFGLSAWVPFLSSTGLYLLSLLTLTRLKIPKRQAGGAGKSARGMREEISSGLRWVWERAYFRSALLVIAGSNLVFQGLILTVAVLVREQGRPASTVGLIMAAGSIGGLLGAFSGGWLTRRLPMRRVMIYAHVAWALIMPGTVFLLHPVTLGILFFITSHIGAAVTVCGMSHQVRITPDAMQGRVGSVVMLLVSGASSIGALGTGYLLEGVGTRGTLAIASGVMALLAVVATVVFTRRGAELEDRSAQDEASGHQRELTAGPPTTMTLRRIDE
ncbi:MULTISPECIES: MFS transporter [unclassified Streptomyces]|uniref:MFS transporter n=1 Tax=unclassified Streptomyces TaxID=2593676 RepID=UPI0022584679|nr:MULTISPECIES: MFS transporter [unclassified Streptomyces]MCX4992715.1 MFS transporter [Streptomyces sp. NBC_00568]MCX5002048.1 MFS transporter [Streptomyces sp. NBC_00638]